MKENEILRNFQKIFRDNMKKIYLSGPITGVPDFKKEFATAEMELREMGTQFGFVNPAEFPFDEKESYSNKLCYCICRLSQCDAIMMLPGWDKSDGAMAELYYAYACWIPVVAYPTEQDKKDRKFSLLKIIKNIEVLNGQCK